MNQGTGNGIRLVGYQKHDNRRTSETLKPVANIDEYLDALSAPTEESKMRKAIAVMCSQVCYEICNDECPLKPWKPDNVKPEKGVDYERSIV